MNKGKITSLSEWEDKLSQMEPWALMAEDIADTFRRGELINKKFLDSVQDLIKLGKDDDVIKLVQLYYSRYVGSVRFGVEVFIGLVDLGYLDVIDGKDPKCYMTVPLLVESGQLYKRTYDLHDYMIEDAQIDKLLKLF